MCDHFWPFWHAYWPSANTEFKSGQIKIGAATYCWTWNIHDGFSLENLIGHLVSTNESEVWYESKLKDMHNINTLGITVLNISLLIKWRHRFHESLILRNIDDVILLWSVGWNLAGRCNHIYTQIRPYSTSWRSDYDVIFYES